MAKTCDKCGKAGDLCRCKVAARGVPANSVVTAEEVKATPLDIGGLTSLATAVKLAHWNADTKSTEHEALGELYVALAAATDRFVEGWIGKHKGTVTADSTLALTNASTSDLCEAGTTTVNALRLNLVAGQDEDLLNILAEADEALNKARYILKAKGDDMNEPGKVTAAGTSEGAKKGWEHRGSYEGGKVNVYHKKYEDPRFGPIHRVVVDDGEPETTIKGFHSEEEAMKHAEKYIKEAGYKKDAAKAADATPTDSFVQCRDCGFPLVTV